jgi:8-hydroxy-5-deazaflavin:NADPH oxidoreductase
MRLARVVAAFAAVLSLVSLSPLTANAAKIAVIGSGNVANALGPGFAAQGNTIVYGSRNPSEQKVKDLVSKTGHGATAASQLDAVKGADIVVLAVPGTAAGDVVKQLGDLSGKIVLDPTNLVNRSNPDGNLDYPKPAGANSNAELIQSLAPKARVVKAFNTLNVGQMTAPATAGGPITIPICGDDAQAKATIAGLVKGMGLEVVDLGPLRYANALEQMLVIWGNARAHGQPFNYYLRPQPPPPAK